MDKCKRYGFKIGKVGLRIVIVEKDTGVGVDYKLKINFVLLFKSLLEIVNR